ncbi:group 3 secretory phospholipase A2 [Myxocyprinus asiaticus]|uniref:group 3 secretory phospholipase A2 n=1 Tax=Myxocyprinus asiaticus TaxID=70543 RepID=UPI002222F8C2|nr:group 3 secretory phospholipase A2 [Myxocyprinus asiaticus]
MSLYFQYSGIGSLFHAIPFFLVVFFCNALTVQNGGDKIPFCLVIKPEHGSFQVSFLINSRDASASLLYYWSKWTSERRVEDCFTINDGTLIERYLSLCDRLDNAEKLLHFNLSVLLEDESLCEFKRSPLDGFTLQKDVKQFKQLDSSAKNRQKRAWVLPGTLWCGRGTSANNYEQLGMFEHADRCCREHDHCEHIIRAFSVNFGVFNPTFFTISRCDCDHRFKQCLLSGNDTISNMVGYSFFNVLKLRCFELVQRKRCIQFNWFGMCTTFQLAPVAVLKDSTPYNSTNLTYENNDPTDLSCNEVPIKSSPNGKQTMSKSKQIRMPKDKKVCAPVDHLRVDTFQLSQNLVNQYDSRKKLKTSGPRKGRKNSPTSSFMTLTPSPQRVRVKQRTFQKYNMETVLQSTPRKLKASVTGSPSTTCETKFLLVQKTVNTQAKQMSAKSRAKTFRRKKKKRKAQSTVRSRKTSRPVSTSKRR